MELNEGKLQLSALRGGFSFEEVGLSYPGRTESAVRGLSFSALPGEVIALVGPSGSSKGTLLSLVTGFVDPASGRILIDGHDMARLDLRLYRRWVSIVPQDPVMFGGTIRQNVNYGFQGVSETRVVEALRQAQALDFVERLPGDIDAFIGDRGCNCQADSISGWPSPAP